jgi:hypothetical protein
VKSERDSRINNLFSGEFTSENDSEESSQYNGNKLGSIISLLCYSADFLMNLLCTFILPTIVCYYYYKLSLIFLSEFLGIRDTVFNIDQIFFIRREANLVYCLRKLLLGLSYYILGKNSPVISKEKIDIIRCMCIVSNQLFNTVVILLKIKIILIIWNYKRRLVLDGLSQVPVPGYFSSPLCTEVVSQIEQYFSITLPDLPVWLKQSIFILISSHLLSYYAPDLVFWQWGVLWNKFGIPDLLLLHLIDYKILRPVCISICQKNNIRLLYLVLVTLSLFIAFKKGIINTGNMPDLHTLFKIGCGSACSGIFIVSAKLHRIVGLVCSVLYQAIKYKRRHSFSTVLESVKRKWRKQIRTDFFRSSSEIKMNYSENYTVEKFLLLYSLFLSFKNSVDFADILFLVYSSNYTLSSSKRMRLNETSEKIEIKPESGQYIPYIL